MRRSRWLQYHRIATQSRVPQFVLALVFSLPAASNAYEFLDTHVIEDDGVFHIRVSAIIAAPAQYVRNVLTDYSHLYRLSPSIIENEVLPSSTPDEKQIRTRLLCCTSVFCREVERVDTVRLLDSGEIEAEIIPSLSEFKSGKATWKITDQDTQSHVVYEAYLEPDFFIPPLVGAQLVADNLRKEFTTTFIRMERIARVNLERDWSTDRLLTAAAEQTPDKPCKPDGRASLP